MPSTIKINNEWTLLSDVVPNSALGDKFKGQVQSGSIKLKESGSIPTNLLDCYAMRAADSGGDGDEFFEAGDGAIGVYAIAFNCTSAECAIEVKKS